MWAARLTTRAYGLLQELVAALRLLQQPLTAELANSFKKRISDAETCH